MEMTVLVDNYCSCAGMLSEYGLSVYFENGRSRVLMDTGSGRALIPNMLTLGIDPTEITDLVLSHGHYDHTGGIPQLFEFNSNIRIWAHPEVDGSHMSIENGVERFVGCHLNKKAVDFNPVKGLVKIEEGIWAVEVPPEKRDPDFQDRPDNLVLKDGETFYPDPFSDDISLVLEGSSGLSVILGCAHAGVVNILEEVSEHFNTRNFDLVAGGMHTRDFSENRLDKLIKVLLERFSVTRWGPCHCSGFKAASWLMARADNVSWYGSGTRILI